jgi:hypothetical protein
MRTSTRISPRIGRLAGGVAILFVPLTALLVALLARTDDIGGGTSAGLATLEVSGDALAALRWVVAAALLAVAAIVGVTLARRH